MAGPRPRVLIRTRPIYLGNYGGILQAYAVQQVLKELGFSPVTDASKGEDRGSVVAAVKRTVKRVGQGVLVLSGVTRLAKPGWVVDAVKTRVDAPLREFIHDQMAVTRLYNWRGRVNQRVLASTDAFLVGSDQIWRASFGRVESYLLDFLPANDDRPRISYAASFGRSEASEFSEALRQRTALLAARLDAISVRESSGVTLCSELWGIDAAHHLDPTMLLAAEHYRGLVEYSEPIAPNDGLVTYVLDTSEALKTMMNELAHVRGMVPVQLLTAPPQSLRMYKASPAKFQRPSIEQWILSIDKASLLVTDSFHGTVFAILMNTPFLTVVNTARGAARFESILGEFGLLDRLVTSEQDWRIAANGDIDWGPVNRRVELRRAEGRDFLAGALSRSFD